MEASQKKTRAQRLAYARIMRRETAKALAEGNMSKDAFEYAGIFPPEQDQNGKWHFPVKWKQTLEEPICIYGNEAFLKAKVNPYKNMTIEDIKKDLLQKQAENENRTEEFQTYFESHTPKTMGTEEKKELDELEKEFPFDVLVEKNAVENVQLSAKNI